MNMMIDICLRVHGRYRTRRSQDFDIKYWIYSSGQEKLTLENWICPNNYKRHKKIVTQLKIVVKTTLPKTGPLFVLFVILLFNAALRLLYKIHVQEHYVVKFRLEILLTISRCHSMFQLVKYFHIAFQTK